MHESNAYHEKEEQTRGTREESRGPLRVCFLFFFGVLYVMYEKSGILSHVGKEAVRKGENGEEGFCLWCILARDLAGNDAFEFKRFNTQASLTKAV